MTVFTVKYLQIKVPTWKGLESLWGFSNGHFLHLGTQAGLGHRGVGGVISLGPLLDIQGK